MLEPLVLGSRYIRWHYREGLRDRLRSVRDASLATAHFFSLPLLFVTFFDPFLREPMQLGKSSRMVEMVSLFILRIMGVVIRGATALAGVSVLFLVVVLETFFSVLWFFLPLLLPILFILGVMLLIHIGPAS